MPAWGRGSGREERKSEASGKTVEERTQGRIRNGGACGSAFNLTVKCSNQSRHFGLNLRLTVRTSTQVTLGIQASAAGPGIIPAIQARERLRMTPKIR